MQHCGIPSHKQFNAADLNSRSVVMSNGSSTTHISTGVPLSTADALSFKLALSDRTAIADGEQPEVTRFRTAVAMKLNLRQPLSPPAFVESALMAVNNSPERFILLVHHLPSICDSVCSTLAAKLPNGDSLRSFAASVREIILEQADPKKCATFPQQHNIATPVPPKGRVEAAIEPYSLEVREAATVLKDVIARSEAIQPLIRTELIGAIDTLTAMSSEISPADKTKEKIKSELECLSLLRKTIRAIKVADELLRNFHPLESTVLQLTTIEALQAAITMGNRTCEQAFSRLVDHRLIKREIESISQHTALLITAYGEGKRNCRANQTVPEFLRQSPSGRSIAYDTIVTHLGKSLFYVIRYALQCKEKDNLSTDD